MMKILPFRKVIIFCTIVLFSGVAANSLEFSYKFKTGDKYRIVSAVTEDVFVNRQLRYKAEILNRISMEVTGVSGDWARHSATFQSAEKAVAVGNNAAGETASTAQANTFQWARDYRSEFEQDRLGYMRIDEGYYMPMVRNAPVFPGKDVRSGEAWSAAGVEVHDFRDSFGIEKPYRIPFTANYTCLGERVWKGKLYPAFSVSYRIFMEPEEARGKIVPQRIIGASDQIVYWDVAHGQAVAYEEHFRTILELSDGQTWEYRGRAEAEVVEASPMNKEEMAKSIAEDVNNIPDASVRVSDEGIVISLENIRFAAESAVLLPSERPKLDKIAQILMKYPDRDILVGGHTALAGNAEGRMRLSLERAVAVADYLLGKNVRAPERVVIRGYGAEWPIADNRTPEGMEKNRRVEITILEN
jgi:outer membrane protein OmpA-like peptidoglycan-associated protein